MERLQQLASARNLSAKVAAVVVTYNRKALLLECIECLLDQTVQDQLDIIVVDNASTDGTREALASYENDGSLIYLNTRANLGGAGGFSFGMREAAERGYGWAWVMDDDCMPEPTALEALCAAAESLDGKYGFLSSKVLWKDGSICAMNVQRKTVFKNVEDFSPELVPVEMASFVSLFVPCQNIRRFGLPIKEFFIWTDDWEFTRRLSRELPCYLVTSSIVVHKSERNLGANIATSEIDRIDRFGYLYRNDVVLYRREGAAGFAYEVVRLAGHVLRVLFRAPDHRLTRVRKLVSGTAAGLKFYPVIEYPGGACPDD
ncbi:glycosyltransferase [Olsenella sp. An270]|uniref:glycosyltransferase n=1 Tax=Olsenella sp. An270 TaxID=1965615 RepID=UPI000B3ACFE9|nr:glycosyltransferase [Olsenella sp. An270]OUO58215.1 glycosyl transferase [Olsenella sp. An270]